MKIKNINQKVSIAIMAVLLMSLFAIFVPQTSATTTYFSDSFEYFPYFDNTNTTGWSLPSLTPSKTSSYVHTGTYSLNMSNVYDGSNYIYVGLGSMSILGDYNIGFWAYIDSSSFKNSTYINYQTSGTGSLSDIWIFNNNSTGYYVKEDTFSKVLCQITPNVWHHYQTIMDRANDLGQVNATKWYVDGVEEYNVISNSYFGQPSGFFIHNPDNGKIFVDDVSITDSIALDGALTIWTIQSEVSTGGTMTPFFVAQSQADGTSISFSATPNSGYIFDHWQVLSTGSSASILANSIYTNANSITIYSDVQIAPIFNYTGAPTPTPVGMTPTPTPKPSGAGWSLSDVFGIFAELNTYYQILYFLLGMVCLLVSIIMFVFVKQIWVIAIIAFVTAFLTQILIYPNIITVVGFIVQTIFEIAFIGRAKIQGGGKNK